MSEQVAQWLWFGAAGYAAIGVVLALVLLFGLIRRVDGAAADAPMRVKVLIAPGLIVLWPVMLALLAGWRPREDRA